MALSIGTHQGKLGKTGLAVSSVVLGAASLGQDSEPGKPTSDEAVTTALAMLNSPFSLIDTSNSYGGGRSEAALGAAIARTGGVPDGMSVISKADRDLATGAFTGERVMRSFEETTARLGVDYLPIYQLHDPYSMSFSEAMAPRGAVSALLKLRDEGCVGHLGIAAGPLSLLTEYVDTGLFEVVLTHNRFTLLNRSAENHIAEWASRGLGVFNAAPFGGGLLARGSGGPSSYAYEEAGPDILSWVQRLESVCAAWEVPLPAAAIQFSMRNAAVSSTVVGTASQNRIARIKELSELLIPEGLWEGIAALGSPPVDFGAD